VVWALALGELVPRGQPLDAPGVSEEFEWEWLPFVRAEHAEGVLVAERNGLRLPLSDVTIIDRRNSMIWLNRLSGPRIGFRRVEYRRAGTSEPLSRETAIRQAMEEDLKGQAFANRVCELCQVKRDAPGFGKRNLQIIARKIRRTQ